MKIRTNISKLIIHDNMHKNVTENMLSFTIGMKFNFLFFIDV